MEERQIKVKDAFTLANRYTVLVFETLPRSKGHVRIEDRIYETEIAYDMPNCIGVKAVLDVKELIGKVVEFV